MRVLNKTEGDPTSQYPKLKFDTICQFIPFKDALGPFELGNWPGAIDT